MSIATVVTGGFGNGTIPFVVTRGYSIDQGTILTPGLASISFTTFSVTISGVEGNVLTADLTYELTSALTATI